MRDVYFPQGISNNETFCNREAERSFLKSAIESHENIVLIAPRRYGKTSLITQVLKENSFIGVYIDLFFSLTQEDIVKQINENITHVINQHLPKTKQACNTLIEHIKKLNPKFSLSFLGQRLEISPKEPTQKNIAELLLLLDQFMQKINKSCVVACDEFQQIAELPENHAIEAAIRHAVERSKKISYIFCGSKRHLLNEMFSHKSRPLYHLCDLMTLDRISTASYTEFLNKLSKEKWKKILEHDVLTEIIELTENHPYYVNVLCRHLWKDDSLPTLATVRNTWSNYIKQQTAWLITDISGLTFNRKKVLITLAFHPTKEPQGLDFCTKTSLNPSGVRKALLDLEKFDLVYQDKNNFYRILDPAMAYFIRQNTLQ